MLEEKNKKKLIIIAREVLVGKLFDKLNQQIIIFTKYTSVNLNNCMLGEGI